MYTHRFVAAAMLVALASGCSSAEPEPAVAPSPSAAPNGDAVEPTGTPPVTEGPATAGASWPDGVSARLVAVQRVPNAWGVDVAKSQAIVRLTLEVTNGSQATLPVTPATREMTLLYGPNREEADSVTSYSYTEPAEERKKALNLDGGTQIPVSGEATFVESGLVPVDELDELAVVVEVPTTDGIREPFTLTGVGALVKQVK
ncbi:hypothetical protein KBX53_00180 [Micromonospora sp. M51]|uniref:hypothetical protein n=1 Tax=Micromonospora sp. M51 TaxID=2824889 RepID=UPI001B380133|nr:hypothetical protein [Micromonospora sp. M51]MBQ1009397.1 hypothetical protein [Micromonospora sp. M51]